MNAFCINLKSHPGRRRHVEEQCASAGLTVQFLTALDGEHWGLKTRHSVEEKGYKGWIIPPYHIGCCLSHWALWSHLALTGEETALILEDDVEFVPDFKTELALSMDMLPADWQVCYVGHSWTDDPTPKQVNERVAVLNYPFGTHCYMVRRSALDILLASGVAWAPVDMMIGKWALPALRHYTFVPSLARQAKQIPSTQDAR